MQGTFKRGYGRGGHRALLCGITSNRSVDETAKGVPSDGLAVVTEGKRRAVVQHRGLRRQFITRW